MISTNILQMVCGYVLKEKGSSVQLSNRFLKHNQDIHRQNLNFFIAKGSQELTSKPNFGQLQIGFSLLYKWSTESTEESPREKEVHTFTYHAELLISNSTCWPHKLWKIGFFKIWIFKGNSKESVCTHGKTPLLKISPSRTLLCVAPSFLLSQVKAELPTLPRCLQGMN